MKDYDIRFLILLVIAQFFVALVPMVAPLIASGLASDAESLRAMKQITMISTIVGRLPTIVICALWLRRRETERDGSPILWLFAGAVLTIQGLLLYLGFRVLSEIQNSRK